MTAGLKWLQWKKERNFSTALVCWGKTSLHAANICCTYILVWALQKAVCNDLFSSPFVPGGEMFLQKG